MSEFYCAECNNTGWLDCYCGGDLCVCSNNGEYPCPHCTDGRIDDDEDYGYDEPAPSSRVQAGGE